MKRSSISKRVRFDIFKRDSFTCQYCGKQAPDVLLEIDHIDPVCKGGKNDPTNLVTACVDCNRGKSGKQLSENNTIKKQKEQLNLLNKKREQLEMMHQWKMSLLSIDEDAIGMLSKVWSGIAYPFYLNENGLKELKILYKKFSYGIVFDAINEAEKYIKRIGGKATKKSVSLAWGKVSGICYIKSLPEDTRERYYKLIYVKKILKNRFGDIDWHTLKNLNSAMEKGADIDAMGDTAKEVRSIYEMNNILKDFLEDE